MENAHVALFPRLQNGLPLLGKRDIWWWGRMTRVEQAHEKAQLIDVPEIHVALVAHELFMFRAEERGERRRCVRSGREILEDEWDRVEW